MDRSMEARDPRRLDDATAASTGRLSHLSDLKNFKVADGDPDIRGWVVKTSEGVKLGKISDLLVDGGAMKVRYMEVALDKRVLDIDEDRHVLVPIGAASIHDDEDVVVITRTAGELIAMPEYVRGTITLNDERVLYDRYRGTAVTPNVVTSPNVDATHAPISSDDPHDLYDSEHFDDRTFRSRRSAGDNDYLVRHEEERRDG